MEFGASVALAGLLLHFAVSAEGYRSARIVHPTDYASASGMIRWHVDPSDRRGAGEARYTLYFHRIRIWTQTLPFTLRDAVVADDGALAGYAYVGGDGRRDLGDFLIASMRVDGRTSVLARQDRVPSRKFHTNDGVPGGLGVFITGDHRLVVRVNDAEGYGDVESWSIHDLNHGAAISRLQPRELQPDHAPLHRMLFARPLAGTPLVLVQWFQFVDGADSRGTRFALLDGELRSVWSLDLPDDFNRLTGDSGERMRNRIRAQGSVLETYPGGFAIWRAGSRERVDYLVAADDSASQHWRVAERRRSRHPGPRDLLPGLPELPLPPERPLEHTGRITLEGVALRGNSDSLETIATVQVTPTGRIHAVDRRTGAVHIYATSGKREQICRPATDDYRGEVYPSALTVADNGEIHVLRKDNVPDPDFLRYSATCARIGVESLKLGEPTQTWVAQPGSEHRWVIGYRDVYRVDAANQIVARLQRTANGRWLDQPHLGASAEDGSLVVLSESAETLHPSEQVGIRPNFAFFSATGRPLRVIPAPPRVISRSPLAYLGHRLAFVAASDNTYKVRAIWVMDATTGASYRVKRRGPADQVFLVKPAENSELWVFDGERYLDRYRLP